MGQQDKGLLMVGGQTLVKRIIACLLPQCAGIIINANRNLQRYEEYGYSVVSDQHTGFQGPLAGIYTAMLACETPWLVTVPCDAPYVSAHYVQALCDAIRQSKVSPRIAVARDAQRLQPVHALIGCHLHSDLADYLSADGRKIDRWYQQHSMVEVDFSDHAALFENVNTPAQLTAYERSLSARNAD